MKFLTLFKIILISNICMLYCNAEKIGASPSDRYEIVINKSICYIQYFFNVLNELEDLKQTTNELICEINQKVRRLDYQNSNNKEQNGIQKILKRLEQLLSNIQNQINEWDEKISQEKIDINFNDYKSAKAGDYKTTIKNLIKLYGYIVKLITKFNSLRDQTERHIENVSRDVSNINTTMESKEKTTDEIHNVIIKFNKDLKQLRESTLKEIENCKLQIKDIEKKNKEFNKIVVQSEDNKQKENNNKQSNKTEEKIEQPNKNKAKEILENADDSDIKKVLECVPTEKILEYIHKNNLYNDKMSINNKSNKNTNINQNEKKTDDEDEDDVDEEDDDEDKSTNKSKSVKLKNYSTDIIENNTNELDVSKNKEQKNNGNNETKLENNSNKTKTIDKHAKNETENRVNNQTDKDNEKSDINNNNSQKDKESHNNKEKKK